MKLIRKYHSFFLAVLSLSFFLQSGSLWSQVPQKPTLYVVTVDPETGKDEIIWYSSPSLNTDYYEIGISVINSPNPVYVMQMIGEAYPPDTVYYNSNNNTETVKHPVGYSVWAVDVVTADSINSSLYDEPDSTIYLQSTFDSCKAEISLSWNDYNNWRNTFDKYILYERLGPGIYNVIADNLHTRQYIIQNVTPNRIYQLFVEEVNTSGIRSNSSRAFVNTQMSAIPAYINADYATISPDNTITLSFTIDPAAGLKQFQLVRSKNISGPFENVSSFNTLDKNIQYTDNVSFTSGIYYYKLYAINNCGAVADSSNLASNIILQGSISNNQIVTIGWNNYLDWTGGVNNYSVTRTIGTDGSNATTYSVGTTTTLSDDLTGLINYLNPYSSLVCYQITATENLNIHGIQGQSISNRLCLSVNPDVRLPNAIIPNDNDEVDREFDPVFSFMPERYDLVIYNRLGTKIWEGSVPWNGKSNGKYVPEGVYLYYLKVFNFANKPQEYRGQVTVIYR